MNGDNRKKGILIRGVGGLFGVCPLPLTPGSPVLSCRARGIFRHEKITPLPGDTVVIQRDSDTPAKQGVRSADAEYVIDEILPRTNTLVRPPLANLTHLFLMIPSAHPAPDLLTADKLISIAEVNRIEPVIVISKQDLDPAASESIRRIYADAGFSTFVVSVDNPDSVQVLREYILSLAKEENPVIAAFAGASAAGKSTMMMQLFPGLSLKTGDVSRKTERGRQTTRHVELFPFEAGGQICLIADTPGFSLLDFTQFNFFDPAELPESFREFRDHLGGCRYTKCSHTKEEGCAILAAVKSGTIPKSRHQSFLSLYEVLKKKTKW
jgi:ribosome biogenesis GTPase